MRIERILAVQVGLKAEYGPCSSGVVVAGMEVLAENVLASSSPASRFTALVVNFKKLKTAPDTPPGPNVDSKPLKTELKLQCSWQDVLHAVAGLCSVALPDMEETAIYSSLTRSGSKTIVLFTGERSHSSRATDTSTSTTVTAVTEQTRSVRVSGSVPVNVEPGECRRGTDCSACSSERSKPPQCAASAASEGGSNEEDNEVSFNEIFSSSEASDTDSVAEEDDFSEGRRLFLEACRKRRNQQPVVAGAEEMVAGCGCFLRLSDRPQGSAVQILLLAVRHRWRRSGLGSFLLQTMKDPAVVGHYDALLTFSDHKAERFFATHGFSEDPILTAKYRAIADHWENSSLMAYAPPFSGLSCESGAGGTPVGSLAALSLCEDSFKSWRECAIASYCEQLSLMQRLRHEVVLLHSKLESREADIRMLTQQLQQVQREKSTVDLEFANYRKQTQKLLCDATIDKTQQWLDSVKHCS